MDGEEGAEGAERVKGAEGMEGGDDRCDKDELQPEYEEDVQEEGIRNM